MGRKKQKENCWETIFLQTVKRKAELKSSWVSKWKDKKKGILQVMALMEEKKAIKSITHPKMWPNHQKKLCSCSFHWMSGDLCFILNSTERNLFPLTYHYLTPNLSSCINRKLYKMSERVKHKKIFFQFFSLLLW